MLNGWNRVVWQSRRGRSYEIYHRLGEEQWREIATRYSASELPELVTVHSSRFAIVQRRGQLFFKRFLIRDWRDFLKHLVRPSRARRALLNGELLESLNIKTPHAACLIEERRFGFVCSSALITEAIDDTPRLWDWLHRADLKESLNRREKCKLLDDFAREMATWHGLGLHHADMRLGNVLCRQESGDWKFFWLDNEGNSRHAVLRDSLRVHNLMQANMDRVGVTLSDRMRFWKTYVAASGLHPDQAVKIRQAVIAYTQSRWQKFGWL